MKRREEEVGGHLTLGVMVYSQPHGLPPEFSSGPTLWGALECQWASMWPSN